MHPTDTVLAACPTKGDLMRFTDNMSAEDTVRVPACQHMWQLLLVTDLLQQPVVVCPVHYPAIDGGMHTTPGTWHSACRCSPAYNSCMECIAHMTSGCHCATPPRLTVTPRCMECRQHQDVSLCLRSDRSLFVCLSEDQALA